MHRSRPRLLLWAPAATAAALLISATPAAAQGWLKDAAKRAAKRESARQVDRAVSTAVRCAVGELKCYEDARARGDEVVFVDERGEVVRDADGKPVDDPARLPGNASTPPASTAAVPPPTAPDASTNSNYDFQPGEELLFRDDYSGDLVGDFPRDLEFVRGNWDVVEWQGRRLLRNTGPRGAAFRIQLPSTLPEKFTLETEAYFPSGNQQMWLFFEETQNGMGGYPSDRNAIRIAGNHGTGVISHGSRIAESWGRDDSIHSQLVPIRIMADGGHVKVFVGEHRVANIPNAVLPRTRTLQFENVYFADEENPMYLGPIRIMAGGRDLYQALATDGRVAIHDILFDVDAATIRPESASVLAEIGGMLDGHAGLSLMIEGHTDSTGEFDHNMELSRLRAESVKQWLVEKQGIETSRLRTLGLGSTQPKASNDDELGRQQNRRVELVRVR